MKGAKNAYMYCGMECSFTILLILRNALFWVIIQRVVVISYTTTRCVITQKSAVLSYFAAEG
jgi:hypothetical protein